MNELIQCQNEQCNYLITIMIFVIVFFSMIIYMLLAVCEEIVEIIYFTSDKYLNEYIVGLREF